VRLLYATTMAAGETVVRAAREGLAVALRAVIRCRRDANDSW
jgi:hypothetical protein